MEAIQDLPSLCCRSFIEALDSEMPAREEQMERVNDSSPGIACVFNRAHQIFKDSMLFLRSKRIRWSGAGSIF